ncbi:hypothetical protein [Methanobrevibacter sp.]|uniref:hypothetical protein n=1 Tax=Methanobrevibacter sp. TaxID=66852 RepID=UPI0025D2CE03|nr:hypothetical protein [Methanobrevibacter sp.]MBQ2962613.1 hypothetical protein [Methanobrevibacter sp.]
MEKSSKLKLGFVFAIFLIFIVAMNPASAAFFGLFEDPVQNVTVDGIEFTIPGEYEFNETSSDLMYAFTDDTFKENNGDVKVYRSEKGNITIMVSDSKNGKISNLYSAGYDPKTVNGHKGALKYMSDLDEYLYAFQQDGKLAVVYVTNETMLEDIIPES